MPSRMKAPARMCCLRAIVMRTLRFEHASSQLGASSATTARTTSVPGQRERHVRAARWCAVLAAAASNHDVLPAIHYVHRRRGTAGKGQLRFPEQFASELVVGVELLVPTGGTDEEQPVRSNYGPAVIVRTCVRDAFGDQLGILAERNLPADLSLVQIDGVERAPGR